MTDRPYRLKEDALDALSLIRDAITNILKKHGYEENESNLTNPDDVNSPCPQISTPILKVIDGGSSQRKEEGEKFDR